MLDRTSRPLLHVSVLAASFAALLLSSRAASASTTIAGGSYGNQTWTAAGSPYIVTGSVTLTLGSTLTIQPGVEVQFANTTLLTITGTLSAVGTAANPITLKAQSGVGKGLWLGIKLNAQGAGTTLDHVHIESAWKAIESNLPGTLFEMTNSSVSSCDAAIEVMAGVPVLDGLTLSGNSFGIEYAGFGGGTVSRSTITGSSVTGIDVYTTKTNLPITITNTVIRQNHVGVGSSSSSVSVYITNSTIHGNSQNGVLAGGTAPVFIKNSIVTQNKPNGIFSSGASISTTYSDVWGNGTNYSGAVAGAGCISQDPLYVSAPMNLTLQPSSSCIDAGTSAGAPSTDLLGVARPLDGNGLNGAQFDMGAYEYSPTSVCGDGVVGVGEACDDGNAINTDECLTTCESASCGDSFLHAGVEACDDGNEIAGDGCSPRCMDESAGVGGQGGGMSTTTTTTGTGGAGGGSGGSVATTTTGAGGAGGGSGSGGSGGSMATTSAGAGGVGGESSSGSSDQSSGCGCRTAGGSEGPSPAWLLLAAAVVVARRRRTGG